MIGLLLRLKSLNFVLLFMRKTKFIALLCGCGLLASFGLAAFAGFPLTKLSLSPLQTSGVLSVSKQANQTLAIADPEAYKDLPVAGIKAYPVSAGSRGTVVLIPQYHRNPGTGPEESLNDSAARAQEQIYQILAFLASRHDIELVMMEGELYGRVSDQKLIPLAQKIELRDQLVSKIAALTEELSKNSLDPALEKNLIEDLNREVARADREIILQGAPLVLKSKGTNLTLYGSENENTREQSKVVVRDYLYLQDQLDKLENPAARGRGSLSSGAFDSGVLDLLQALLGKTSPAMNELETAEELARIQGRESLGALLADTADTLEELSGMSGMEEGLATSAPPSRADNPYQNIRSRETIKKLLAESEQEIEQLVVNKRNQETGENFLRMLEEERQTIGVLQYGAGHEEGLIKELNDRRLSVIVITPDEVEKRASQ